MEGPSRGPREIEKNIYVLPLCIGLMIRSPAHFWLARLLSNQKMNCRIVLNWIMTFNFRQPVSNTPPSTWMWTSIKMILPPLSTSNLRRFISAYCHGIISCPHSSQCFNRAFDWLGMPQASLRGLRSDSYKSLAGSLSQSGPSNQTWKGWNVAARDCLDDRLTWRNLPE